MCFLSHLLLSNCDIIVSQKKFKWRRKVAFLWVGLSFYSLSFLKTTFLGEIFFLSRSFFFVCLLVDKIGG